MITVRINNNLAGAQRAAAQLGQADCAASPHRPGGRAFASGAAGVIWFDDRCPADLKGVRRRRKGGRHGTRA